MNGGGPGAAAPENKKTGVGGNNKAKILEARGLQAKILHAKNNKAKILLRRKGFRR